MEILLRLVYGAFGGLGHVVVGRYNNEGENGRKFYVRIQEMGQYSALGDTFDEAVEVATADVREYLHTRMNVLGDALALRPAPLSPVV